MREIRGDLWKYYGRKGYVVCITTNHSVKKDGSAVMGRGVALQASERVRGIDFELGRRLRQTDCGTLCWLDNFRILAFPVKHNWYERANLELIKCSSKKLRRMLSFFKQYIFVLPRPGCGNGRLEWQVVRKVILPILISNRILVVHNS